jgi:hypothetical protein
MSLERLTVVHARKMAREGGDASAPDVLLPAAFSLETCLRRLWISPSSAATEPRVAIAIDAERYVGVEAYEFLLRVACGLESAIAGESDVFGQLKVAWKSFSASRSDASRALEPLLQRLFEDVKEIRALHLSGLGATTYGSLARTLLGANADSPTLLIGAGQMARSVLPYLPGRPLWIANRTPARATTLLDGVRERVSSADIQVLSADPQAELAAWQQATNVVVCVPADPERDLSRVQAWTRRRSAEGQLLHLGILSLDGTPWGSVTGITTLNDLFSRQSANQDHRQLRFERARRACRERARLRNLGGPVNLAHGWEDLSLFANIA